MDHMPVFLRLRQQPCLVVGGGIIAERKVRLLMRAGGAVTVAAPELTAELTGLRRDGRILHHPGAFNASLLAGKRLVIAATDDAEVNGQVADAAERDGVLCNVVDDGQASSFIVPAIVDRSPVVIAIGTGGNAPALAQWLKSRIEAWLPERIDALARQAGRWRNLVKNRYSSHRERQRFWHRFFDGPIAQHLLANRQQAAEHALRLELIDKVVSHNQPAGEAYIVGAGPGDPGLVTLRAQQLIGQADVVLYDRLVLRRVLDFARKDAQLISVGKSADRATITQQEINELLVSEVQAGRRVCRLKGGDPFVFGRGGEEIQALADRNLPFQVVPGISAALGCAAYAGIPLTQRGLSGSVTFATAKFQGGGTPDWSKLASESQTLVLYMGVGSVDKTTEALLRSGLSTDTPAAIVENGTTEQQRVVRGTLATIADEAIAARVCAPAVIIIGRTAGLGEELEWFKPQSGSDHQDVFSDASWGRELEASIPA